MSLLLRTRLIRHPPSIHVLSGADATPGETRDAKTEYISRMPETTLPEPPSGPQPGRWVLSHGEIRTIVFGLMLAMFLAALNQTIVATALPTIGRDFRDFELLPWVVTAYLLSSTVVAPLYGKLSDIHGRRAMMLAAVGIFTAGSIACALATDMIMLILGRALQGIGGGGILPLAQSILADAVAPRERGHYQAYMGSVWVTAGLGGPVIGGILAEHFHWSIIFWFNVPLGLIAAVMAQRSLKRLPRHERPHQLDERPEHERMRRCGEVDPDPHATTASSDVSRRMSSTCRSYQSVNASSPQSCLDRSARRATWSSISRVTAAGCRNPCRRSVSVSRYWAMSSISWRLSAVNSAEKLVSFRSRPSRAETRVPATRNG